MIPKIIHYCWFGGKELPLEYQNYIKTWKEKMPDFKIKLWNEDNSPMELPYMKIAYENKNWANLSNYVRLHAVFEEGGIYLDTDVEARKSFSPLLDNNCFFGLQIKETNKINSFNNAIFGATPNHIFVKKLKDALLALYDGSEIAYLSSPHLTTYLLNNEGYKKGQYEQLKDIQIYPREYFFPYSWEENFSENCITENTFAIHYWSGTWSEKKTTKQKSNLKSKIKSILKI